MPNSVKKKTPERKCIGCSEKKAKNELIRVVRLPDGGGVEIDRTGKKRIVRLYGGVHVKSVLGAGEGDVQKPHFFFFERLFELKPRRKSQTVTNLFVFDEVVVADRHADVLI